MKPGFTAFRLRSAYCLRASALTPLRLSGNWPETVSMPTDEMVSSLCLNRRADARVWRCLSAAEAKGEGTLGEPLVNNVQFRNGEQVNEQSERLVA
jgi:hypothetical protein